MAFLRRFFRTFWVIVFALVFLGVPLILIAVAKTAQNYLRVERHFGEWGLQVYGAEVSPWFAFHADSARLVSPYERIVLTAPALSAVDLTHGWSYRPRIQVRLDSIDIHIEKSRPASKGPAKFPVLRFLFPVSVDWRVLDVTFPNGRTLALEQGHWHNRGLVGLAGGLRARWIWEKAGPAATADIALEARWRGGNVRYKIGATQAADTLSIIGMRDKADLSKGRDSLSVSLTDVGAWLPPSLAAKTPPLGLVSARGLVDWKRWRITMSGNVRVAAFGLLEPCTWNWAFHESPEGGGLMAGGKGAHQNFRLDGEWTHPTAWPALPEWNRLSARFSGKVQGVRWKIGTRVLPMDVRLTSLRVSPGLRAEADVVTGDSSHAVARWRGDQPKRVEWNLAVSPHETWATIWTDTNVSYASGQLQGLWDGEKLRATARFQKVRAYGAVLDSVWSDQEVNGTGYYLRAAHCYDRGRVFQGAGHVEWGRRPDTSGAPLEFTLTHPQFGRLHFSMPKADSLDAEADQAQCALFPYQPLQHFADYRPEVNGHFAWNTLTGVGATDLKVSGSGSRREVHVRLNAMWNRTELHLDTMEIATADSRLEGAAVLDLDSASLAGLGHVRLASLRSWRLHAERLRVQEVTELLHRDSAAVVEGVLDGSMAYSGADGLRGELRGADVRIPSLHGLLEIPELVLSGQGDSIHLHVRTISGRQVLLNDTADIGITGLRSRDPHATLHAWTGPLHLHSSSDFPDWKTLQGEVAVTGEVPLGGAAGSLEDVNLEGNLSVPLDSTALTALHFASQRLRLRYSVAADTQWLSGSLIFADGVLKAPDLKIHHSQGGDLKVQAEAKASPLSGHLAFQGDDLSLQLPSGQHFQAKGLAGSAHWAPNDPLALTTTAQSVAFHDSGSATGLEGTIADLHFDCTLPPPGSNDLPKAVARAQLQDFLFRHKLGFEDLRSFFRSFKRKKGSGSARKTKPWDLDLAFEAVGTKNHIDTDVLRVAFVGDLAVNGIYPYTLFRGKITGLNGEIGQPGQAYDVRDLEIKWENATLEQGTIYVEGEKKLLVDCKPGTTQQCNISIKLDGTLDAMNFTYDSDCGQNVGEPVTPTVLINSMTQGCYSAELQSGQGSYGETVLNMLEPQINEHLSRAGTRWTGGFLQSTQVTGLGSLAGSDTSNLESVALEVQSKEKYRVSLQAKAGYFPEKNLPDPWEYRLAVKYRPPLEKLISDSTWHKRFQDRLSIESGVETELEKRNLDIERRVTDEVELRYHYHFWNLW